MGALQDLQNADTNLAAEVDAVLADVVSLQGEITKLEQSVQAGGVLPSDLQPIIDNMNAKAAQIQSALSPPPSQTTQPTPPDVPPPIPA